MPLPVECCPENIKMMKSEEPKIVHTGIHKLLSVTLVLQRNHVWGFFYLPPHPDRLWGSAASYPMGTMSYFQKGKMAVIWQRFTLLCALAA
jgi:hypothetical protein